MRSHYLSVSLFLLSLGLLTPLFGSDEQPVEKSEVKVIEGTKKTKWLPEELRVQEGDIVEWHVKAGQHGVLFENWGKARRVLEPIGGLRVEYQELYKKPAMGTFPITREGNKTLILRVRVKAIPEDMTEIPYFCTLHNLAMQGKLILRGPSCTGQNSTSGCYSH